jgi:shikimate kinase
MSLSKIVLCGFMGTGKTTVGKLVADQLGWDFVDTDALIVERAGITIPDIFKRYGEAMFRSYERQIAQEAALWQRIVLSTGGGMPVNPENLKDLQRNGLVICLNASPEAIEERLGTGEGRPLANDWRKLLEARRDAYARIPHHIDTTGRTAEDIAQEVIALWQKSS